MANARLGIFRDEPDSPIWVGMCRDLPSAKATAQLLANREKMQFFVYSFDVRKVLERFKPAIPPNHR